MMGLPKLALIRVFVFVIIGIVFFGIQSAIDSVVGSTTIGIVLFFICEIFAQLLFQYVLKK